MKIVKTGALLLMLLFAANVSVAATKSLNPVRCENLFSQSGPKGPLAGIARSAGGSTGGRWVKDEFGITWFLKKDVHHAELQTSAEVISALIYQFFGYKTPETAKVIIDGVHHSASRDIGENNEWTDFSKINSSEIRQMRVVASFLKDWDRLGNPSNNRLSRDGTLTILDFGGTLGSRAQGNHKPGKIVSAAIGSFESTIDIGIIYDSFQVQASPNHPWNQVTRADVRAIVQKFSQLDNLTIEGFVDLAQYSNRVDRDYMVQALQARRDGIVANLLSRFP